jgi:hypothetical protein
MSDDIKTGEGKFDSRKYRIALIYPTLGAALEMANHLSENMLWLLIALSFIYMLGNVGAAALVAIRGGQLNITGVKSNATQDK